MNEFNELVKKYMEFDKETLAQLLALKEISKKEAIPYEPYCPYDIRPIGPYYEPQTPIKSPFDIPITSPTNPPYDYQKWIVTCCA